MVELRIFFLFLAVLVISAKEFLPTNDEHNIYTCINPHKPKLLLASIPVNITSKHWQVQTKSVFFPFQGINDKKITCLSVLDKDINGTGAYPRIQSGGIGYHDVLIVLTSQRSQGIVFDIKIYADRKR